jgi:hypothetical protein
MNLLTVLTQLTLLIFVTLLALLTLAVVGTELCSAATLRLGR